MMDRSTGAMHHALNAQRTPNPQQVGAYHMETRLEVTNLDGGPAPECRLIGPLLLDIVCPAPTAPLRVVHGSRPVATSPDAADAGSVTLSVPLLALPAQCRLLLQMESGAAWIPLAEIGIQRQGLPPRTAPKPDLPRPLLATSVGRSGSTLLMQLLSSHPDIAIHCEYPFETIEARKRFAAALDSYQRMCRGQWESKYRREGWERLLLTTIASHVRRADEEAGCWYADLHRRRTGSSRPPVYYAEKNLGPAVLVQEARPDAREIFLVRDPRDMICSTLAFIEKRGESGFGRQEVGSDLDYVRHRAAMARPWVIEPWLNRGESALLVRYEDLVRDGHGSLARIFAYLGIDDTTEQVAGILAQAAEPTEELRRHMTTSSPAASIGRWRHDLTPELQQACRREFADFLATFGYTED